jgi:hypothetical protein
MPAAESQLNAKAECVDAGCATRTYMRAPPTTVHYHEHEWVPRFHLVPCPIFNHWTGMLYSPSEGMKVYRTVCHLQTILVK